jgi:hypothetical protein
MLSIKEKPYVLLLLTAIALLIVLVFSKIVQTDFQDKSMFSVPLAIFVWIIPLLLTSFWLLYFLTKRLLYSMTLIRMHILITVSTTILIVIFLYVGIRPLQSTTHSEFYTSLVDRQELIGNATQILFLIFVCGQLIYLANVLLGIFKKSA